MYDTPPKEILNGILAVVLYMYIHIVGVECERIDKAVLIEVSKALRFGSQHPLCVPA